jgi:hypothetical protein
MRTGLATLIGDATPGLSDTQRQTLLEQGTVSQLHSDLRETGRLELPLAPAFGIEVQEELASVEPTLGVEMLFLLDSPTDDTMVGLDLYRVLQSIGSMTGIEYYSSSRGERRELFSESYVIANPRDRTPLADPIASVVPQSATIYILQRDASFGRNVFMVTYTVADSSILLSMSNETRMYVRGIIPAVAPDRLRLALVVRLIGEGKLLLYGACAARSGALFGLEEQVQESFQNRLIALHDWFVAETSQLSTLTEN